MVYYRWCPTATLAVQALVILNVLVSCAQASFDTRSKETTMPPPYDGPAALGATLDEPLAISRRRSSLPEFTEYAKQLHTSAMSAKTPNDGKVEYVVPTPGATAPLYHVPGEGENDAATDATTYSTYAGGADTTYDTYAHVGPGPRRGSAEYVEYAQGAAGPGPRPMSAVYAEYADAGPAVRQSAMYLAPVVAGQPARKASAAYLLPVAAGGQLPAEPPNEYSTMSDMALAEYAYEHDTMAHRAQGPVTAIEADYADASELEGGYIATESALVTRATSYMQAVVPETVSDSYGATGSTQYSYGPVNDPVPLDPNYNVADDGDQVYATYDTSAGAALSSVHTLDSTATYEATGDSGDLAPSYDVVGPVTDGTGTDAPNSRKDTIWTPPNEEPRPVSRGS